MEFKGKSKQLIVDPALLERISKTEVLASIPSSEEDAIYNYSNVVRVCRRQRTIRREEKDQIMITHQCNPSKNITVAIKGSV